MSGYDCWKRKGLRRHRKLESVGAETTSSDSPFQIRGAETLKARLPTVDSRNRGTTRRLELAEHSARRPRWLNATKYFCNKKSHHAQIRISKCSQGERTNAPCMTGRLPFYSLLYTLNTTSDCWSQTDYWRPCLNEADYHTWIISDWLWTSSRCHSLGNKTSRWWTLGLQKNNPKRNGNRGVGRGEWW